MELLAPAGNLEILKIAIESGCDAVYISGKNYGARKFADNFTNDELEEAVRFAHLRKKKVYVTVNTLIYDEEFKALADYLTFLDQINVDAIIVQDLGVIHFIRSYFPQLTVHASTQLNINSVNGVKKLIELGVKRVVLARETPLEIIKEIVKTSIEVEVFAHGALCFSCSGQCLMSYLIGGRSGNRGECAQPCRKNYDLIEDGLPICNNASLMSMKDLNVLEELSTLQKLNITSLKIEGRLKSAAYVSTVVRIYRNHLNNIVQENDLAELELAFNRQFTKGYMFNVSNQGITNQQSVNHRGLLIGKVLKVTSQGIYIQSSISIEVKDGIRIVGQDELGFYVNNIAKENNLYFIKGNFKVKPNDLVYKTVSNRQNILAMDMLNKEVYQYHVNAKLSIVLNNYLALTLSVGSYQVIAKTIKLVENAINPLDADRIISQIKKTNNLLFVIDQVDLDYDNKAFIKISELNNIRRIALKQLEDKILSSYVRPKNEVYPYKINIASTSDITAEINFEFVVNSKTQYDWCIKNGFSQVYMVNDEKMPLRYLNHLNFDYPFDKGLVHNLGEMNPHMSFSSSCNIMNKYALDLVINYHPHTVYLSNELSKEQIINLAKVKTPYNKGIFLYGRNLLLVSHHCFVSAVKKTKCNCENCLHHQYYLRDEYQNKMLVKAKCYKYGPELLLYDYKLTNRFNDLYDYYHSGISNFMIVLTDEDNNQLNQLGKYLRKGVEYGKYKG